VEGQQVRVLEHITKKEKLRGMGAFSLKRRLEVHVTTVFN